MRRKILVSLLLTSSLFLCSCSTFIPKKVELFQDKVKAVPEATTFEKETQKQAASLAAKRADDTFRAAILEKAPESVLEPASDTMALTRSVSTSLGPPVDKWDGAATNLADKLDTAVAKLNRRLDSFANKQEENVGKKIEGSGLFQVPYFLWLGGFAVLFFFGFVAIKIALAFASAANPGVAVGTRVLSGGAALAAKGFGQLIHAGEGFKDEIENYVGELTPEKVKEIFRKHHQQSQDRDVQAAVRELTA